MAKAAKADVGHNSNEIGDDDKRVLFFIHRNEYVRLLAAKKAADAAIKNHGKKVKADLGDNGMSQIKLYEELLTPEGEAKFKARMEAERQAAAWAGLPIDTQIDMFENLAPLDERAFGEGEEAGLRGDSQGANPYDLNSEPGRKWAKGWEAGQAKLAEGFKKLVQPADEVIKGENVDDDPGFAEDEALQAAE